MTQEELEHEREVTITAIDNLSSNITRTNKELSILQDSDEYWRDQLLHTRRTLQDNRKNLNKHLHELQVVCSNIETILHTEPEQKRSKEKSQEL